MDWSQLCALNAAVLAALNLDHIKHTVLVLVLVVLAFPGCGVLLFTKCTAQ